MLNYFKKQLVLIGGGHANIQVLKKLCMNEYKGIHTVLINDGYNSIYSGMTPGYIQKQFSLDEISIDLQRLCYNAGATFINDRVIKLDCKINEIELLKSPKIGYDFLSINTGSAAKSDNVIIDNYQRTIFAKPISSLVEKINIIDEKVSNSLAKLELSLIGGGLASFELAISLNQRYEGKIQISIYSPNLLGEKNILNKTKNKILNICRSVGIKIINQKVHEIKGEKLILENSKSIKSDFNIIATGTNLDHWLKESSLDKNELGFIKADEYLKSINYKNIFITGDIVKINNFQRSQSGVMAVRQGEVLSENIFLIIQNKKLKKFKPQKNWLYLININNKSSILNYYFFSMKGRWCWYFKKWIDTRFIKKFVFNDTSMKKKKLISFKPNQINVNQSKIMYCQGCGSKVSKKNLVNYLNQFNQNHELPDSSKIKLQSTYFLQTIDHIKLFSSFDPFLFGRVSYLHSQNDILASGGKVNSLSISIGVPYSEGKTEGFFLKYFIEGISKEAQSDRAKISSGHSYLTEEPSTTITMNGDILKSIVKNKANKGDLIYLSKTLGTGYLLAAYFQNSPYLKSSDIKAIISHLLISNKKISDLAIKADCNVMTDISGFGLASHLGDICKSSNLSANIELNKNILLNNNLKLLHNYKSTGFDNNYQSMHENVQIINNQSKIHRILYDPQTNGPMLIVVNKNNQNNFEKYCKKSDYKTILIGNFISKGEKQIYVHE